MLVKRIVSELIDIVVLGIAWAVSLLITLPLLNLYEGPLRYAAVAMVIIAFFGAPILFQYLFWKEGRSIGKVYIGLVVVREDTQEKADFALMITREVLSKWLSLWIVCIPLFAGRKGIHEQATKTEVKVYTKPKK